MKYEPIKVTMATSNYKKKNDIFKQFIDEWIEEKEGKVCNSFEMYSSFREWQKETCPNHSCPDKNEFSEYFIRLWGPYDVKAGWKNKYLRGPIDNE
jgi:phage/plasmid-associated DNA primase